MCEWLNQKLERTPGWLNQIWLPDKVHCLINGSVYKHNYIFWDTDPNREITEMQLKRSKITAFVAYDVRHGVFGPYWLEKNKNPSPSLPNVTQKLLNSFMMTTKQPLLQVSFVEHSLCRMGPHLVPRKAPLYIYTKCLKIELFF